ncbi:MAG: Phage-related transcriptional regulator [Candidatus Ruthia sp. Asou_11_S2]|nr:Phage-related transcriptional regulator [Candidatus Ruthia sp. Asou_11_S2]
MQILTIEQKDYALIPMSDYNSMLVLAEDVQDIADMVQFDKDLASGKEELIPSEFAERLIFGENPYLVWREYRGLTLKNVSDVTGIDVTTISRIENNKRDPSVKQVKSIAQVLKIEVTDLI